MYAKGMLRGLASVNYLLWLPMFYVFMYAKHYFKQQLDAESQPALVLHLAVLLLELELNGHVASFFIELLCSDSSVIITRRMTLRDSWMARAIPQSFFT